jgi:hypothetical protein
MQWILLRMWILVGFLFTILITSVFIYAGFYIINSVLENTEINPYEIVNNIFPGFFN